MAKKDKTTEEQKQQGEKQQIFRKSALKKLSSPEHLDKLIKVTDSKGWLALGGALFLVVMVVIWSFVVNLPTKAIGGGVLIKSGGIKSIQHGHSGLVTDLSVTEGDIVEKGDVVARVSSKELLSAISNARFELKTLHSNLERYEQFIDQSTSLKRENFVNSTASLEEEVRDLDREIKDQKRQIAAKEDLFEQGSISKEELRASRGTLDQLESVKDSKDRALKEVKVEELTLLKQHHDNIISMRNGIASKRKEIEYLQDQLDEKSKIISAYSGRVMSVVIEKGKLISAGEPLITVELDGKDIKNLEAITFIPAMHAKNIEVGMEAQVAPSSINSSEYGVMLGRVTKVTEYPVSYQYMAKNLGEEMAKEFANMLDPIEITVDLIPDANNKSGFRWSSRQGPPVKIKSGTPSTVSIVVKKKKPITLIFPVLSGVLDGK